MELKPISFSGGTKSISDDDLCATCSHCQYRPGEMSECNKDWPGLENSDGYVQECSLFDPIPGPVRDSAAKPVCCPYCGSKVIREIVEWESSSIEDSANTCRQMEHQCQGECQGRSFWC